MKNVLRRVSFIFLSIQCLFTVNCAPVSSSLLVKHSYQNKKNGVRRGMKKSQSKFEKAGKKLLLNKKTAISVNGHFLPVTQVATSDKDIHVTVTKADGNTIGQQPNVPPNIQEVTATAPNGAVGMSPGYQIPIAGNLAGVQPQVGLHPGIQTTDLQPQVGLHPGIQTQNTPGTVGLTNTNIPPGMAPGIPNPGTQTLGMSPGLTGAQVPGAPVGMHPGIPGNNQIQSSIPLNQGIQTSCGLNNQVPGQILNAQGQQDQIVVGKGSDGQLTYKSAAG